MKNLFGDLTEFSRSPDHCGEVAPNGEMVRGLVEPLKDETRNACLFSLSLGCCVVLHGICHKYSDFLTMTVVMQHG